MNLIGGVSLPPLPSCQMKIVDSARGTRRMTSIQEGKKVGEDQDQGLTLMKRNTRVVDVRMVDAQATEMKIEGRVETVVNDARGAHHQSIIVVTGKTAGK